MTRSLDDARRWVQQGTKLLGGALGGLDEDAFAASSGLAGWTRKHLVAHVAANADAIGNLVRWAATGERTSMYSSPEQRNADIEAGAAYANEICATCHAVLANEEYSPLPQATPFQTVADTPGMTELALTVFLQSSHPTMPNIILEQDDMRNVVTYIRSLKPPSE